MKRSPIKKLLSRAEREPQPEPLEAEELITLWRELKEFGVDRDTDISMFQRRSSEEIKQGKGEVDVVLSLAHYQFVIEVSITDPDKLYGIDGQLLFRIPPPERYPEYLALLEQGPRHAQAMPTKQNLQPLMEHLEHVRTSPQYLRMRNGVPENPKK